MSSEEHYPIERTEYGQRTGRLLARRLRQIIVAIGYTNANGYTVWSNKKQSNGVDLKIWHNDELILVAEIFNWCICSTLNSTRQDWIINNLQEYPSSVIKVLIHSEFSNMTMLKKIQQNGIYTLNIGCQILPKYFYDFYARKNQVKLRRIDSRIAFEEIKSIIVEFLIASGLGLP